MIRKIFYTIGAAAIGLLILLGLSLVFLPINVTAISNVVFGYSVDAPSQQTLTARFKLPPGFSVGLYADGLKKVRMLAMSQYGDLLASQPREGSVVLLARDQNGDNRHDGKRVLLEGLNAPHGLEFYQQWLYVAEADGIGRVKFNHQTGQLAGVYERIVEGLPAKGNHWSKTIRIKDQQMFVSIGSTCNVCIEDDKRRATIMVFDVDGSNGRVYADGLRNSVGLDFAPWDGSLFATDNGRDLLGDDYPVCELNKITDKAFYGWPFINGFGDLDPDFGESKEALLNTASEPAFGFPAHNAPLGIRFIRKATMPAGYERSALVALHGSWNRSKPDGYKVVALHWQADGSIRSENFLTGFEVDGDIIGRPVDIVEGLDGCLFVSDDFSGSIYRICYGKQQSTLTVVDGGKVADMDSLLVSSEEHEQLAEQGADLYYNNNCQACHTLTGSKATSTKRLVALGKRYSLLELRDYFLLPNPPMPTYQLTENERTALAVYLLSVTD